METFLGSAAVAYKMRLREGKSGVPQARRFLSGLLLENYAELQRLPTLLRFAYFRVGLHALHERFKLRFKLVDFSAQLFHFRCLLL